METEERTAAVSRRWLFLAGAVAGLVTLSGCPGGDDGDDDDGDDEDDD
ncbi:MULTISPECIES: hypothetical protein [Actinoplanes]|nr:MULTISPECIES: hypothetical protein [Actinoplanes]